MKLTNKELDPLTLPSEDLSRAMMEVQMHQLQNVFDFVAAHLTWL